MSTPPASINAFLDSMAEIDDLTVTTEAVPKPLDDTSDLFTDQPTDKKKLIRSGLLTIHPPSSHPQWLQPETYFPNADDIMEMWCAKFERGTQEGTLHLHAYFRLKHTHRMRFERLFSLITKHDGITGFNFLPQRAVSKKSTQCAVNYVLKPDTAVGEPFIWNASCQFDQKLWDERKKKLPEKEAVINHIMSKPWNWAWDALLHESDESRLLLAPCGWAKKLHESRATAQPRRKIKDVVILYGAAGTGKTTLAVEWDQQQGEEKDARYYRRNCDDGHFWGGGNTAYKGQRIIHFDEFTGQEKFNNLKEWTSLNQEGPPINVKGKGATLNHETVLFTSNTHPAGWYKNLWGKDPKQFDAFQRRVTRVLFFPELRPDGSINDPTNGWTDDVGCPYYYVDQTPEWVTFSRNLDLAIEHAMTHWPIPDSGPFVDGFEPPADDPRKRARFF